MISVSLIIPCYNEAEGLGALVAKCLEALTSTELEIILVNNGSTDHSGFVFESLKVDALHNRLKLLTLESNNGYGQGILAGLEIAQGQYLGWTHADLQTDPTDVIRAIEIQRRFGDDSFVKGRRYGRPFLDVIFTVGMSFYETLFLRKWLWDINAQPSIFPRSFYQQVVNEAPRDFSLDLYFYYSAKKMGLSARRFPVSFGKRQFGKSSWNIDWASKKRFISRTIEFSKALKQRSMS